MLATAVALNLEGAPAKLQEEIAGKNGTVEAILGGQDPRHVLSAGLAAMPPTPAATRSTAPGWWRPATSAPTCTPTSTPRPAAACSPPASTRGPTTRG